MNPDKNFWCDVDKGLLILRLTLGVLIFFHGWFKIFHGIDMPMSRMESWGIPGFLMYFAYVSEVLAPILIVLGVFFRLSTLTIFITMTVVFYIELKTGITFDQFGALNIEKQLFYWFMSAGLFFTGPGNYRIKLKTKHWLLD
jgi:putative oxidoreductase